MGIVAIPHQPSYKRPEINELPEPVMRKSLKWSACGIATVLLLAVLLLWPDSIPLTLTVTGVEPAGIVDESGNEMHVWSLTVTNTDSVRIIMGEHPALEFNVGDDWVATDQRLDFGRVEPNQGSTEELLLPTKATACRMRLTYQTETWKVRLLQFLGPSGRRQLAKMPWLAKHLWTDQRNTFPNPPSWREVKLTVDAPLLPEIGNHQ